MNKILFLIFAKLLIWTMKGQAVQEDTPQEIAETIFESGFESGTENNFFNGLPEEIMGKVLNYVGYYDPISQAKAMQVDKRFQSNIPDASYNSDEVRDSINNSHQLSKNTYFLELLKNDLPEEEFKPILDWHTRVLKVQDFSREFEDNFETANLKRKKTTALENSLEKNQILNAEKAELVKEMHVFLSKYKDHIDRHRLNNYKELARGLETKKEQFQWKKINFSSQDKNLEMSAAYRENLKIFSKIIQDKGSIIADIQKEYIEKMEKTTRVAEFEELFQSMKKEVKEHSTIFVKEQEKNFYEIEQELENSIQDKYQDLKKIDSKIESEIQFRKKALPDFLSKQEQRVEVLKLKAIQENASPKTISDLNQQKERISQARQENEEILAIFRQGHVDVEQNPTKFLKYSQFLEKRLQDLNISRDLKDPSFPEIDHIEQQFKKHTIQVDLDQINTPVKKLKNMQNSSLYKQVDGELSIEQL